MRNVHLLFAFGMALAMSTMAWGKSHTKAAQVIAHRGYWTCLEQKTQNSRASLEAALKGNHYGSETDVWLTTDGVLMANHDPSLGGVTLQTSTEAQCRAVKLSNGESMPSLEELLLITKQSKSRTKLIIEVKTHATVAQSVAAANEAVRLVKKAKMRKKVEYIAFSLDACIALTKADPKAKVAYLNGDKSPAELHAVGITGLDYTLGALRKHPTWVEEAHKLGMTVNVWTIDKEADMEECNRIGVDYITTNYPEETEAVSARFK